MSDYPCPACGIIGHHFCQGGAGPPVSYVACETCASLRASLAAAEKERDEYRAALVRARYTLVQIREASSVASNSIGSDALQSGEGGGYDDAPIAPLDARLADAEKALEEIERKIIAERHPAQGPGDIARVATAALARIRGEASEPPHEAPEEREGD